MYCGQCGKRVMDNMLFCPFCGSPIVIPDQDVEPAVSVPVPEKPTEKPAERSIERFLGKPAEAPIPREPERPVSLFDSIDDFEPLRMEPKQVAPAQAEAEPFVPLHFDFDDALQTQPVDVEPPRQEIADVQPDIVDLPDELPAEEEKPHPARRPAQEFVRPELVQRRNANTYIPVKEIDPQDMFMDGFDEDDFDADDYDEFGADDFDAPHRRYLDEDDEDFDFEEPEHGSFFMRHIRGVVAMILLLIVLAVCAIWAISPNGQSTLAQMNLAWDPQAYADLGYAAYQQNSALLAARYYEKALQRDGDNYEYAHSAMVAYYEADQIDSAAAMLKKCIELDPDNADPYLEMLILYPDAAERPWDISELIRLGYQRTGNEALKQ